MIRLADVIEQGVLQRYATYTDETAFGIGSSEWWLSIDLWLQIAGTSNLLELGHRSLLERLGSGTLG